MFDYVKGSLISKSFPNCTVENNGIGYCFLVNSRTVSKLPEINSEVKIYSKLIHKEDSMFLCGFLTREDRTIFDILTSVSGIGTKAGFALLDAFETDELIGAVINEDYKLISKTKGIGEKTAQKIVLELKDKLIKLDINPIDTLEKRNNSTVSNETINQAQTILQSLGYTPQEYKGPLETALTQMSKDDSELLLKETLKILSLF